MIRCLAYIEQAESFMRVARFLVVLSILPLTFVLTASAQKTRKPVPRPTPTPYKSTVNPVVSAAKEQVGNQLYNVNVFIDKMGPIAVVVENADKEASAGRLKKEARDANEINKKKIVAAIRGLRDGLMALETDFRTKPLLAQYLPKLQGISTLSAQSEDDAIAGQFVAAKDPLRQIALKLNDTLAIMPGPAIPGVLPAPNRNIPAQTGTKTSSTSTQAKIVSTPTQPTSTAKSVPALGMSPAEVLLTSWGKPIDKRTSGSANGTTEVWIYPGNRTVYFFNGVVTNIVQ